MHLFNAKSKMSPESLYKTILIEKYGAIKENERITEPFPIACLLKASLVIIEKHHCCIAYGSKICTLLREAFFYSLLNNINTKSTSPR